MIYHNRYLAITNISEMGQYTFDNLKGFEEFSRKRLTGGYNCRRKKFWLRKLDGNKQ